MKIIDFMSPIICLGSLQILDLGCAISLSFSFFWAGSNRRVDKIEARFFVIRDATVTPFIFAQFGGRDGVRIPDKNKIFRWVCAL